MKTVVYVVAKAPTPGAVKTRLCPPLSGEQAAALALAFLLDTVETVRRAGAEPRVVCRDASEARVLRTALGAGVVVRPQAGAGLGDALLSAFRYGQADGFAATAVLGADSPTLPVDHLREAFDSLEDGADVALGPSEDGGYYLLAARRPYPALFERVSWSTASVAEQTLSRCARLALRRYLCPPWYDVDDSPSLARLRTDLSGPSAARAPATRAALARFSTQVHAIAGGRSA